MKSLTWTYLLLSPSAVFGRPIVDSDNEVQIKDPRAPGDKADVGLLVERELDSATATALPNRRASHIEIEVERDVNEDSTPSDFTRRDQGSSGTSYCCMM